MRLGSLLLVLAMAGGVPAIVGCHAEVDTHDHDRYDEDHRVYEKRSVTNDDGAVIERRKTVVEHD